jgi:hypothetical protein
MWGIRDWLQIGKIAVTKNVVTTIRCGMHVEKAFDCPHNDGILTIVLKM